MATKTTKDLIRLGDVDVQFVLDDLDTAGAATVFAVRVGIGALVPVPHSHDAFDETAYGLGGEITWTVDGEEHVVGAGEAICIRRGQVHGFVNRGTDEARFLCVATPGVFKPSFFIEIAEVLEAAAGGPPDLGAVMAIMLRHGLTPALPNPTRR